MRLAYDLAIRTYRLGIGISSVFGDKARQWIRGRRNWRKKLTEWSDEHPRPVWIHCASLGEFEQGRPLIEIIRSRHPRAHILLTFFSPSGYEMRKSYDKVDGVFYLPLDTRKNARDFLDIIRPSLVVFVKYEFWYHFLNEVFKRQIPAFLISGVFREGQLLFRPHGQFLGRLLHSFKTIFVQEKGSQKLLFEKGYKNVEVAGDNRLDRVWEITSQDYENPVIKRFTENKTTLICGSTWPDDERFIVQWIGREEIPGLRVVIAPHDVSKSHVKQIKESIKKRVSLLSEVSTEVPEGTEVLIIDSIGILNKIYRYGNIAYVGGGFGESIHNLLEPAAYGIPVVFGPKSEKFPEASGLQECEGGFRLNEKEEFAPILNSLLHDEAKRVSSGKAAMEYVKRGIGATQKVYEAVAGYLESKD